MRNLIRLRVGRSLGMTVPGMSGMRGRCLTLASGIGLVIATACSDVPSDPDTPFSIEFNHAPSPSVVLGDTLFDSSGIATPLRARVFRLHCPPISCWRLAQAI